MHAIVQEGMGKKKNPLRKYKGKAQYNGFKNSTLPIGVNMMNYMGENIVRGTILTIMITIFLHYR
jgi:hypothetical protein